MILTKEYLNKIEACPEGVDWFLAQKETDSLNVLKALMAENQLDWANWLIVRVMERKQYLLYGVFAAEQVLDFFEKLYPNEGAPRLAIEAARKVIENDTEEIGEGEGEVEDEQDNEQKAAFI